MNSHPYVQDVDKISLGNSSWPSGIFEVDDMLYCIGIGFVSVGAVTVLNCVLAVY